ncbi:MAG TPA: hypothetical protein VJM47_06630, partial [Nitrosospira sp.]|nr:hypothetical protein [Nitrosospira sp.]
RHLLKQRERGCGREQARLCLWVTGHEMERTVPAKGRLAFACRKQQTARGAREQGGEPADPNSNREELLEPISEPENT